MTEYASNPADGNNSNPGRPSSSSRSRNPLPSPANPLQSSSSASSLLSTSSSSGFSSGSTTAAADPARQQMQTMSPPAPPAKMQPGCDGPGGALNGRVGHVTRDLFDVAVPGSTGGGGWTSSRDTNGYGNQNNYTPIGASSSSSSNDRCLNCLCHSSNHNGGTMMKGNNFHPMPSQQHGSSVSGVPTHLPPPQANNRRLFRPGNDGAINNNNHYGGGGGNFGCMTTSMAGGPNGSNGGRVKFNYCVFCKNNGEELSYYGTHTLKNDLTGGVNCPVLFNYICPICNATGEHAHTIKYCPKNRSNNTGGTVINQEGELAMREASITELKRMRMATGRQRVGAFGAPGSAAMMTGPPPMSGGHHYGGGGGGAQSFSVGSGRPPPLVAPTPMRPAPIGSGRYGNSGYSTMTLGSDGCGTPFDTPPDTPGCRGIFGRTKIGGGGGNNGHTIGGYRISPSAIGVSGGGSTNEGPVNQTCHNSSGGNLSNSSSDGGSGGGVIDVVNNEMSDLFFGRDFD